MLWEVMAMNGIDGTYSHKKQCLLLVLVKRCQGIGEGRA
jgi:hypothetical protein